MATGSNRFSYHICGNSAVVLINLKGDLDTEALETFEGLRQALFTQPGVKSVILNFAEIETITLDAIPSIALLQKTIRERKAELRMCSIKLAIKEKLGKAGILRNSEISEDSKVAIISLFGNRSRAA